MEPQVCVVFAVMFFTSTVTVLATESEEEIEARMACISLTNPEVAKCCTVNEDIVKDKKEKCNTKEGEMTCETAKCLLEEDGLDSENIDMEKASQKLDEIVSKHSEMKDVGNRIKDSCLKNRKFEKYPPGDCPAASMVVCTYMNAITECQWKDTEQCQKYAEDAKICKKAIDSM